MKVLSSSSIYATRALLYMCNEPEGYVNIKKVAKDLDISFHFLTKIFQKLTKDKILQSYRGPNGGITFTKSPEKTHLIELVLCLEGKDFFEQCLLGLPGCGKMKPCPAHDFWSKVKDEIREKFEETSLFDLKELKGRITVEELIIV